MTRITTIEEYNNVKERVDSLINEATEKGLLEPEMDNEYTREIGELSKLMADFEENEMNILPLRAKSPLIVCIEDYFFAHNMRRKDGAKLLGVNESAFSQIMSGKRKITMSLAKKLHTKLGIDANTILTFA